LPDEGLFFIIKNCITVDFETLKDQAVTVRDRDMMKQERVKIAKLETLLMGKLNG